MGGCLWLLGLLGLLGLLAIRAISDDMPWLPASKTDKTISHGLSSILWVSAIASLPIIAILHLDLFEPLMLLEGHSHLLQPPLLHIPQAQENRRYFS
jgi:hypothetical protein